MMVVALRVYVFRAVNCIRYVGKMSWKRHTFSTLHQEAVIRNCWPPGRNSVSCRHEIPDSSKYLRQYNGLTKKLLRDANAYRLRNITYVSPSSLVLQNLRLWTSVTVYNGFHIVYQGISAYSRDVSLSAISSALRLLTCSLKVRLPLVTRFTRTSLGCRRHFNYFHAHFSSC